MRVIDAHVRDEGKDPSRLDRRSTGCFLANVESPAAPKADRRSRWMWPCFLFVLTVMVFKEARNGAFLSWDDDINMVTNPHLRSFSADNLRWMFTDASYMRRYVPLAWLNWSIDAAVFGLTPRSAHVGNIVCHALNAVLVFLVLRQLLAAWKREPSPVSGAVTSAALAGAMLWAWHPLRVEVVAWASGRMYCQAGFFLLLSLLAYLRAARSASRTERVTWIAISATSYGASLLTYPIGLMFFAVLPIVDGVVLRRFSAAGGGWRGKENRGVWLEKLPFAVIAGLVAGATLIARLHARGLWDPPPTLAELGLGARFMQACYVWIYYVWRPLVPAGLAPVYTTLFEFNPAGPLFIASATGLVAVTSLLIWRRREWPVALALWIAHLLLLAPMLGLTERPHYTNDRYSYIEGVLGSVAIAAVLLRIGASISRAAVTIAITACAVTCAALSMAQVRIWRENVSFFRYLYASVGDGPYRADIAYRLGDVLRAQGRFDEATRYFEKSLQISSHDTRAAIPHVGLGRIAQVGHHYEEAAGHYQAAIALNPAFPDAFQAMGELLVETGKPAEAVPFLQRAVALRPTSGEARALLDLAMSRRGPR